MVPLAWSWSEKACCLVAVIVIWVVSVVEGLVWVLFSLGFEHESSRHREIMLENNLIVCFVLFIFWHKVQHIESKMVILFI
jgi:hypothetical protein